eukprot:3874196-Rhodomonas_salina.1
MLFFVIVADSGGVPTAPPPPPPPAPAHAPSPSFSRSCPSCPYCSSPPYPRLPLTCTRTPLL